MSNRIKLIRIGLAVLIMLALAAYFVPIIPIQIDCASLTMGVAVPSSCDTHSTVTSYESMSRVFLGQGAYLYYDGWYDPGVVVGASSFTLSGVITFIIVPVCVLTVLLILGKSRLIVITKALMRTLGR